MRNMKLLESFIIFFEACAASLCNLHSEPQTLRTVGSIRPASPPVSGASPTYCLPLSQVRSFLFFTAALDKAGKMLYTEVRVKEALSSCAHVGGMEPQRATFCAAGQ